MLVELKHYLNFIILSIMLLITVVVLNYVRVCVCVCVCKVLCEVVREHRIVIEIICVGDYGG